MEMEEYRSGKKSLELACYIGGAGAFGVFLRWLQLQLAFNELGLPDPSVFHIGLILYAVAAAFVFLYFVNRYEDGADHMAAIHGGNFSGGQKQRLLIARAVAAKPEILILDDSSSALDYRTDAELRKAISSRYAGTTLIVIAQRVSSIMNLDEIIVLDEGEMIGKGTHEELMRECPVYREIQQTQMGEVE